MHRISASDLFELGFYFKEIEAISANISNGEFYRLITHLINTINDFEFTDIESKIDSNSNFELLYIKLDKETELNSTKKADKKMLKLIKAEIKEIEISVRNVLKKHKVAYPKSHKLNLEYLLEQQWNLFSNHKILYGIPESIREDFLLFCQCYVYGLYTSAIIHILKATENYNVLFYEKISGNNSTPSLKWGDLISKTQSKLLELDPTNSGFINLISSLSKLKKNHRIEIIHFNKGVYEEDEAFIVFEECRILISKMFYILKERYFE